MAPIVGVVDTQTPALGYNSWSITATIAIAVTSSLLFAALCAVCFLLVRLVVKHRQLVSKLGLHEQGDQPILKVKSRDAGRKVEARQFAKSGFARTKTKPSIKACNANKKEEGGHSIKPLPWKTIIRFRKMTSVVWPSSLLRLLNGRKTPVATLSTSFNISTSISHAAPAQWTLRDFDKTNISPMPTRDYELTQRSCIELRPRPLFCRARDTACNKHALNRKSRARTISTACRKDTPNPSFRNTAVRQRSRSVGSHSIRIAPFTPAPPLPALIALNRSDDCLMSIKNQSRQSPLRHSVSSVDSVGSSLLVRSPYGKNSPGVLVMKGPDRDWAKSLILSRNSTDGENGQLKMRGHGRHKSSKSVRSVRVRLSMASSNTARDPLTTARTASPLRRNSIKQCGPSHEDSNGAEKIGSAKEVVHDNLSDDLQRCSIQSSMYTDTTVNCRDLSNLHRSPLSSRASSTRSSNGDPFHWDRPSKSTLSQSSLLDSPSHYRLHGPKRPNRLSLQPHILRPPTFAMPSLPGSDVEQSKRQPRYPEAIRTQKRNPRPRSLPQPPRYSALRLPGLLETQVFGASNDTQIVSERSTFGLPEVDGKVTAIPSSVNSSQHFQAFSYARAPLMEKDSHKPCDGHLEHGSGLTTLHKPKDASQPWNFPQLQAALFGIPGVDTARAFRPSVQDQCAIDAEQSLHCSRLVDSGHHDLSVPNPVQSTGPSFRVWEDDINCTHQVHSDWVNATATGSPAITASQSELKSKADLRGLRFEQDIFCDENTNYEAM